MPSVTHWGESSVHFLGLTSGSQRLMWPHFRGVIYMTLLSGPAFPVGLTSVPSAPRKATRALQSPKAAWWVQSELRLVGPPLNECPVGSLSWRLCSGRPPGPQLAFCPLPAWERFSLHGILVAPLHSVWLSWCHSADSLSPPCPASWGHRAVAYRWHFWHVAGMVTWYGRLGVEFQAERRGRRGGKAVQSTLGTIESPR